MGEGFHILKPCSVRNHECSIPSQHLWGSFRKTGDPHDIDPQRLESLLLEIPYIGHHPQTFVLVLQKLKLSTTWIQFSCNHVLVCNLTSTVPISPGFITRASWQCFIHASCSCLVDEMRAVEHFVRTEGLRSESDGLQRIDGPGTAPGIRGWFLVGSQRTCQT